jgi:RNA polymerase sigma-70 factor (ECF subfamily)
MQDVTSDAEMVRLVKAAQRLENWAFDRLYSLYADKLYRFLLFRVGDEALAEDLMAEAFVRVLDKIGSFRGKSVAAFSAWLYRIARNLAADHHRRQAKRELVSIEKIPFVTGQADNPVAQMENQQARRQLYEAIAYLTPDQQQVVLFKFFEGMSNAQAAAVLGKTEGAVKSLQHRALATLGRLLGNEVEL